MNKKNPKEALAQQYSAELKEIKRKEETIRLTVDADEDYIKSRETLHNLITRADEALDSLMNLAQESEHPRTFEVLAGLIKTSSDLTERLMNLQRDRDDLDRNKNSSKSQDGGTTNNAIFVGSTSELQKYLKNEKYAEAEEL